MANKVDNNGSTQTKLATKTALNFQHISPYIHNMHSLQLQCLKKIHKKQTENHLNQNFGLEPCGFPGGVTVFFQERKLKIQLSITARGKKSNQHSNDEVDTMSTLCFLGRFQSPTGKKYN